MIRIVGEFHRLEKALFKNVNIEFGRKIVYAYSFVIVIHNILMRIQDQYPINLNILTLTLLYDYLRSNQF